MNTKKIYGKAKRVYKSEVKYVNKVIHHKNEFPGEIIPQPAKFSSGFSKFKKIKGKAKI